MAYGPPRRVRKGCTKDPSGLPVVLSGLGAPPPVNAALILGTELLSKISPIPSSRVKLPKTGHLLNPDTLIFTNMTNGPGKVEHQSCRAQSDLQASTKKFPLHSDMLEYIEVSR